MSSGTVLTLCGWCERVELDGGWFDAAWAIRILRSFEAPEPPSFRSGICADCLVRLRADRASVPAENGEAAEQGVRSG